MPRPLLRAPILLAGVLLAATSAATHAQAARALTIAAASDLQTVLPEIVQSFEREAGVKVTVSFGASGSLFAQIQNGAPFDLFFSADIDYPRRLIDAGDADRDSLYQYATGRLVLWTRTDSGIPLNRGLSVVTDARVRRLAIANPAHAPYGRAAASALRQAGLYESVQAKLVLGENIAQTAQLVESGNADLGILALSLARGSALAARGTFAEVPESAHPPIEQAVVLVSGSRQQETARAFLAYLKRPDTAAILARHGFGPGR